MCWRISDNNKNVTQPEVQFKRRREETLKILRANWWLCFECFVLLPPLYVVKYLHLLFLSSMFVLWNGALILVKRNNLERSKENRGIGSFQAEYPINYWQLIPDNRRVTAPSWWEWSPPSMMLMWCSHQIYQLLLSAAVLWAAKIPEVRRQRWPPEFLKNKEN